MLESSYKAGKASDGMCCILQLALLLSGSDLPLRLLLMGATWWQPGLFMCLEFSMLAIQKPFVPLCLWLGRRLAWAGWSLGSRTGWAMGLWWCQQKTVVAKPGMIHAQHVARILAIL